MTSIQWAAVGFIALVLISGIISILKRRYGYFKRIVYAEEFMSHFMLWIDSQGQNTEAHEWLIRNSPRMQNEIGKHGYLHHFRPPYSQIMYEGPWSIILNAIPEIDRFMSLRHGRYAVAQYVRAVRDALLRHIGDCEYKMSLISGELWNPLNWFREGIGLVIQLPVRMLNWFGLINKTTTSKIIVSAPFAFAKAISALVAFAAALVTIIEKWPQMKSFLRAIASLW